MEALGKHILVEYYQCSEKVLNDPSFVEEAMTNAAKLAGATIINSTTHHFSPWGVSCVVVIQESHLSIHTWPEFKFASVDLYTCGGSVDPWIGFKALSKSFETTNYSVVEMKRGLRHMLPQATHLFEVEDIEKEYSKPPPEAVVKRNTWFQELSTGNGLGNSIKTVKRLVQTQSEFQKIEVFSTEKWGNMLVLDGVVNLTEEDEYIYHEMIVHTPMFVNPAIKRVLIIGGGDGGSAREVLKHEGVETVKMVEIDEKVINLSKEYFPRCAVELRNGNKRLSVKVEDGIKFVREADDDSYDLIIVDSSDPDGPNEVLFTDEFYADCKRVLSRDGIMVSQANSYTSNPEKFKEIFFRQAKTFGKDQVHPYNYHTPTYPTGNWVFNLCTKNDIDINTAINRKQISKFANENQLKYYNYNMHLASFALPNNVYEMLDIDSN